ncbi:hypothetical protein M885DRAFT_591947 [Pelagophyceae sp. CCMP2097]|nr:hypothetical protein M885DRAFT_591947 [Pelagophyceae sp. CCMP2097]
MRVCSLICLGAWSAAGQIDDAHVSADAPVPTENSVADMIAAMPAAAKPADNVLGALRAAHAAGGPARGGGKRGKYYRPPKGTARPLPGYRAFEGVGDIDNALQTGYWVTPPDSVIAVGPDHVVEATNYATMVFDKAGNRLATFPTSILWGGISGCDELNGDAIVVYDRDAGRWVFMQPSFSVNAICIATSDGPDPGDTYVIATRAFVPGFFGALVLAVERAQFLTCSGAPLVYGWRVDYSLSNLSILPPIVHGSQTSGLPIPLMSSQDDDSFFGAMSDALNIFELAVDWGTGVASFSFTASLPTEPFNSFRSAADSRRGVLPRRLGGPPLGHVGVVP